jgi:uncharacterized ion transporter superfamily protein YfcC
VLTGRQKAILGITAFTFALLAFSVVPWDSIINLGVEIDPVSHEPVPDDPYWNLGWWFPELIALFLVASVIVGLVAGDGEKRSPATSPAASATSSERPSRSSSPAE